MAASAAIRSDVAQKRPSRVSLEVTRNGGETRLAQRHAAQQPGDGLAAGDPAAFAALYDRLATRLLNTALTMTGSIPTSEDIVHDVFVELARGRQTLAVIADPDADIFTMPRHAVTRKHQRERAESGRLVEQPWPCRWRGCCSCLG